MRKLVVLFITALLFSLSSVVTVTSNHLRNYELRGYVYAPESQDLPFRVQRLGVNADLLQYVSEEELRYHLDLMREANIIWIRQFVNWETIEPSSGQYHWDHWDQLIDTLNDYPEFHLIVVFSDTPRWVRESDQSAITPPRDYNQFASFIEGFAARYNESVDYYQIWDEPNLTENWGSEDPNVTQYAAMLAAVYPAVHRADQSATVIAAALAPTTETRGANISDILYLQALYQLGANRYFDAVGIKPYGFDRAPTDRDVSPNLLNFPRMIQIRELMVQNGDGHKAIWASAWGWNSLPDNWVGDPSIWGAVSADSQIAYTLQAFERAEQEWPWLAGMTLYHWQPDLPFDDARWGFAIIDQNNMPSALWHALSERPSEDYASNGIYPPQNQYARYSGLWTFGELGADIGWLDTSDSVAEFEFTGSSISLLVREGNYFGFFYPVIDGRPANALPVDNSGSAYLLLRSPTLEPGITNILLADDLSDGVHTLRLVADRGWDQWALVGYAVGDTNQSTRYDQFINVTGITSVITFVTLLTLSYQFGTFTALKRIFSIGIYPPIEFATMVIASFCLLLSMLLTWGTPTPAIFRKEPIEVPILFLLTGGLLLFDISFLLSLISAILIFILIYRNLHWGPILILFYAPFFLFPVELYQFAFPITEVLIIITFIASLIHVAANFARYESSLGKYIQRIRSELQIIDWLVFGYVVLGIFALVSSSYIDPATTEFRVLFIEPAFFYWIIRYSKPRVKHLIYALIASALVVSIVGIFLFIRGEAVITAEEGAQRLASVYGSPNNVAILLSRAIPFALAFAFFPFRKQTPLWLITLGIFIATLLLTQSAGGLLIGLPTTFAFAAILRWKSKSLVPLAILSLTVILGFALLSQISPRFERLLDLTSGTVFMRIRVWESSLDILSNHFMTGLGLDQFLYYFRSEYIRPDAIADPDLSHPHNIVLDFWIRLGFFGLIWILVTTWVFFRNAWHTLQNLPSMAAPIIGAILSMGTLLAYGMIDNSVFLPDMALIFMFFLWIPYALLEQEQQ